MKCQKSAKNAHLNVIETSTNCFLCPNSPKHTQKNSFILMNYTEKQQILTFKTLNQQKLLLVGKMTETINQLSE